MSPSSPHRVAGSLGTALLIAATGALAHEGLQPGYAAADDVDGPPLGPGGQWTPSTPAGYETVSPVVRPAAPATMPPQLGGGWSDVYGWPLVAVHATLLPNGKVISWDATPDDADEDPHTTDNYTTRTSLWDPATNVHVQTYNDTDTDLFCAGAAHLWDGRLLFAGGDGGRKGSNAPLSNTNVYDWHTNTWRREADMAAPRWYASVTALGNGEMLTIEGSYSPSPVAEVFRFDRTWRGLDIEDIYDQGDYQWIVQVPDGSVMSFGPENLVASIVTDGEGAIEVLSERDGVELRDYGSYAMYEPGRILVTGGGIAEASAVTIDTASGQVSDAGDMLYPRRQHNLTILADGSVLVTGGNDDGEEYYSPTGGVYVPELWDPATGRFTALNPMAADRQYHSIALLLPDGRVLSAGGGLCGPCYLLGYEERNAEVYSPPYLYAANGELAVRPVLDDVPAEAGYGRALTVTSSAEGVSKAHLIKLGSPTHSENQDQRLVPLEYRDTAAGLELVMPAARDVAPPGHYLLFVVDAEGVPSQGAMLKLGQPLVRPGESVVSTLEPDIVDRYLYAVNGPLELNVAAGTAGADVSVTVSDAADAAAPACRATGTAGATATCIVGAGRVDDALWHVTVSGVARTDYRIESLGRAAADGLGDVALARGAVGVGGEEGAEGAEGDALRDDAPDTEVPTDAGAGGPRADAEASVSVSGSGDGFVRTGGGGGGPVLLVLVALAGASRARRRADEGRRGGRAFDGDILRAPGVRRSFGRASRHRRRSGEEFPEISHPSATRLGGSARRARWCRSFGTGGRDRARRCRAHRRG